MAKSTKNESWGDYINRRAANKKISNKSQASSPDTDSWSGYLEKRGFERNFSTLQTDLETTAKTIDSIYNGWQTKETMENTLSSVQSIHNRLGQYQEYQKKYGGVDLSELQSSYKSILDGWEDLSKHYGQYKDAESYEKENSKLAELGAMTSSDVEKSWNDTTKEIDSLDLESKLKKAKEYEDNVKNLGNSAMNIRNPSAVKGFSESMQKAIKERDDYLKSIGYESVDAIERALSGKQIAYTTVGGQNITWKSLYDSKKQIEESETLYKDISSRDDFEEYRTKGANIENPTYDEADRGISFFGKKPFAEDIGNIAEFAADNKEKIGLSNAYASFGDKNVYYTHMTEKERDIYNYHLGQEKEGLVKEGTADEYLKSIEGVLKERHENSIISGLVDYTDKNPLNAVLGSAISVWQNMGAGGEWVYDSGKALFTGELDDNHLAKASSSIRNTVTSNVDLEIGNWDAFDFVYNTGMSMADSVASMATFGGAGGAVLGFSAAAQGTNDALERGLDNKQAFLSGLSAGVFEALFESVSISNFNALKDAPVDGIKSIIKNVGKSMLTNASEETLTELANLTYDYIANGDLSQAKTNIRAYINSGMSEKEAINKVALEQAAQVVESGLSGALMGLGFGGVAGAKAYNTSKNVGQTIKSNERVSDMFDIASDPEIGTAYEAYTRYANKGINADNIKDAQLGSLYTSARSEALETFNSKKSTAEQKESAGKTLARLSVVETENTVAKEKSKLNVGEETKVTESGDAVDIKGLRVQGEDVLVATDKGEISVDNMTLADADADIVARAKIIARADGEDVANLFISQYDGKTNIDEYANSFNLTMAYAKNDFTYDTILNKKGVLSTEQVNSIYAETRVKADRERKKKIDELIKKTADKKFYKGFIDESVIDYENTSAEGKINWKDLTQKQREAVTFIKGFAQATGMNLEFVANNPTYNGKYDRTTNTLSINLDKGGFDAINNLEETIIPTMSHETTHWMKEKSPELWRHLNEIVFSTLTEHYNSNTEQAIKDKIALMDRLEPGTKHTAEDVKDRVITEADLIQAEMNSKGKSEEISREEIIARACEDMLKLSEQGRKIFSSLSETEQKSLFAKMKAIIKDLLNWVNDLLNSYEATSTEARIMREYKEQLQKASKVWDEMFKKSVVANQSLEKSGAYRHETSAESEVLEQAKEIDAEGNSYWQIETDKDIFNGIDSINGLQTAAYNYILNGYKGNKIVGLIDGKKLDFIRVSAREYVYGDSSRRLSTEGYKQKMRMSTSIIDLIENASIQYDAPDHKNHKLFPKGFKNFQGRVGIDETIFRYIVRVGKAKNGMIFYDINLEVDGKVPRANRTSLIKSSTSNDSILNSDKKVKTNFSDDYTKAQEMQIEINQLTDKIREMEARDAFKNVVNAVSEGVANGNTEKAIEQYQKWLNESGYAKIRERRDTLRNELNQLRKDLQASAERKALDEEQKAIEKSGLSEADYFRKQAIKEFGYTPYFYDAGYITPNGKMLNFSGEKGQHYGTRGQDHRAIGAIYANVEGSKAMVKFMGDGNIRIMAESPGIDISSLVEPTKEQYATIRKFVREYANKEYFNIDLTDAEGHTVGNYEYEGRISAERVVNDIKYFFENGTTREQSSISQFLYSEKNVDTQTKINTSMTMDEAKQMIQRAFVLGGIQEWYDGEYKNGDEWLRGEGASEVALNIENEYTLTEKYLNKLQGYIDGDFYVEDILDAYLKGTLVGKEKPKAKRLDTGKEYRINDERFYSPQRIKDAKKLLQVATQRVTEKNRKEVSNARAKILLFAHNKGASELLGMTQAELNKKLRVWSNYSAKARDISKRFNNGVADSNKWTGIENCSWLYKGTVEIKDLEGLVKNIKGATDDYEKLYIARTMLALDTHIDWSWLSFEFDTKANVNKSVHGGSGNTLGFYRNDGRKIVASHNSPNTIAHEMGHALDYQWARDLGYGYSALTEVTRNTEAITDAEERQFFDNFKIFIDSLTDNGDIRSEYTQDPKEVFARFVARFIQWVDNTGTGRQDYNLEYSYYNDKFTASHYVEFVKLLQEKAMLDSRKMEADTSVYSEKEQSVYDLMGETDRIRKENENFKAEIERLKERLKIEKQVTKGSVLNDSQLLSAAGHLRNISKSTIDKVELARGLRDVYSFIRNSENLTWEEVFGMCYNIADVMLDKVKPDVEVNDYYKQILHDIRNTRISLSEAQKGEARYIFGKNWNRPFFNRVIITDSGISIDSKWQEWASLYPDVFDADISASDMIGELYNIINTLQDASETVIEYDREEQTRWLANEIYNQYWNVSSIKTTADKYEEKIKQLNFEHRKAMADFRNEYNSRIEKQKLAYDIHYGKLINTLKKKREQDVLNAKLRGQERLDKYKENAERKTLIQSVTANALTLNKWLTKNSKDYHIHEAMKGPVIKLLNAIDFSSKRMLNKGIPTQNDVTFAEAFAEVRAMLQDADNMVEGLEALYGHDLADDIKKLSESTYKLIGDNNYIINAMSNEDLYSLNRLVSHIKKVVTEINKFHTIHHNQGALNLADEFMEHGEKLGKLKKQHGKIGKALEFRNRTPYYFFKDLGDVGKKLFEAFQDGWDKLAFNAKKVIDFAEETYNEKEVKEWSKETKEFKVAQADGSERTFEMSIAQIMALHCVSKQDDAIRHLISGGMTLKRIDKKGHVVADYENITLSLSDIKSILSSLNDRQREVADKLQKFMNTVCSAWGNEISMARFGIEMFGLPDYFPIKVSEATVPTDNTKDVDNASLWRLLNMSFTKSRNKYAGQSIEIGDIFDIFAQHSSDMAKYNALALPVLDFNKFYSIHGQDAKGKEYGVVQTLKTVFGDEANSYLRRFVRDINGSQNVSRDVMGNTFFKNAKIASVAANLRVVLLQPTAFYKASAVMDNKYLMKASSYIKLEPIGMVKKLKKAIADAEKHCGIIQWKSLGYYDTDISKGLTEKIKHSDAIKDKIIEISLWGAEIADKVTFGTLWVACEFEIKDTRKDLKVGSDEFYTEVGKRLRDVIYATQVVDSTMTRSDMMRSSDRLDKFYTTFGSEPIIAYNMLLDVATQYKRDKAEFGKAEAKKKNFKKTRKVLAAYVATNAVAALVESAFDYLRDDDDEEMDVAEFLKLYFKNFYFDVSIGNKLPYVKELYSVMQGYSSSRMDTQWMQFLYSAITTRKPSKAIRDSLRLISQMSGFAFYNVYRDLMATLNKFDLFTTEDLNEMFEDFFE